MNMQTASLDPLEKLEHQALFQKLVNWYQEDIAHVEQWRKNAQEDYDFYNGRQWNEQDLAVLREQNRPVMTFNRVAPLINAVVGTERNNKRHVQFIPRQEGAAIANQILTGAAEWFRDEAHGEYEDSDAFQDTIICGMGWTDTRLDYEEDPRGKPVIARLDPMKMVWDASAVKPNLIDAQRVWYIDEKPLEIAREMFPNVHWSELNAEWVQQQTRIAAHNYDYGDGDHESLEGAENILQSPKMVTLAECRWFEREVIYKVLNPQTGRFTEYSEQDFQHIKKEFPTFPATRMTKKIVKRAFLGKKLLEAPDRPLVPSDQLGWECITGTFDKLSRQFYGIVRPTKDPQRWANKYFSQVMHLLNSQSKGGIMAERDAFDDDRQATESWARADSITWLKNGAVSAGRVQPKPIAQFPNGFFQLFNEAKGAISQVTGLSPEFVGTRSVNQPGVLEEQRRQSSLNLLAAFFDGLRRYRQRQGKIILYLIQNYLSDGRLIRIAGEDNAKYVPLTREMVTSLEYDIVVDDAPTSTNEKERTFSVIMQLLPLMQQFVTPEIMLDFLHYSPLPASLIHKIALKAQQNGQGLGGQQGLQQLPEEAERARVAQALQALVR
ncbi:phage-related protein [Bartonella clarridgeiae 73]|uniref:Phage-related protein n=2 Tax=Bartonella clarridgeiae TaxID=56426 RepID=E6YJ12_BARC7|nr:portal protein [Bartonella clarridgeiae]WCR55916.1 MAG: Phage terminase large subunit [Bartonella clarridgeiae]CBI76850.1 phage-related protein [Bartonella clarridgeiae 73]